MFVIVQYISFAGLAAGLGLCYAAVFNPYWALNNPEDVIRDDIFRYKNLWFHCQTLASGNMECDEYVDDGLFREIPVEVKQGRGFGIASMVLSILAILILLVGFHFWPCLKSKPKRIIRCAAGALGMVAGASSLLAVSLYASKIKTDFDNITQTMLTSIVLRTRWVYGIALRYGWASGAVSIVAGGLAFFSACKRNIAENTTANQQPNNTINEDKV